MKKSHEFQQWAELELTDSVCVFVHLCNVRLYLGHFHLHYDNGCVTIRGQTCNNGPVAQLWFWGSGVLHNLVISLTNTHPIQLTFYSPELVSV